MIIDNRRFSTADNGKTTMSPSGQPLGMRAVDVSDLRPTDTLIAVMGMTGAGKSTFISHCTEAAVPIGHDMTSCTQEVTIYPYRAVGDRNVYLVDTPGFDDTDRTDTQVLKEIATWLSDTFDENVKLSGVIYLHRISDVRMQGSAKRNLFMFKKLCGQAAFKKVRLASTMWEKNIENGQKREKELIETPDFWGYMIEHGAQTYRHMNTKASAIRLVDDFVDAQEEKLVLNIQQELRNGASLENTSAGQEVDIQLREMKNHYLKELENIKSEQAEALAGRDRESLKALEEIQIDYNKKIESLNLGREQLRVDIERMYKDREQLLTKRLREQETFVQNLREQLENADGEEKALLREQLDLAHQVNDQLQKQVTSIGERIKRRAASFSTVSDGTNQMKQLCSLSLYDEYFVFVGGANIRSNFGPIAEQSVLGSDSTVYFVFGQNETWYRHYHYDTYCHDAVSDNFDQHYPGFREECILTRKSARCPLTVALGTNGEYFYASVKKRSWRFSREHDDFLQYSLGKRETSGVLSRTVNKLFGEKPVDDYMSQIKRIWLGMQGAMACLDNNNTLHLYGLSEEPNSVYPGLTKALCGEGNRNEKIKAIAMSLTDRDCWLCAWRYTYAYNVGKDVIDSNHFRRWCKRNQGESRESAYSIPTVQASGRNSIYTRTTMDSSRDSRDNFSDIS